MAESLDRRGYALDVSVVGDVEAVFQRIEEEMDDAGVIPGVNLPVDHGWLVADSWAFFGGLRAPS